MLSAAFGAADAFFQPAALALIPALVPRERLEASNGLVMGSMALTGMIGPALAGVVIAATGNALGFGVDAATFAFAAVTLVALRRVGSARANGTAADEATRDQPTGTLASISEGLRYAFSDAQMRIVLLAVTVINFAVVGPFFVGLPALVDGFDQGPIAYGMVLSAWGAAALVGAVVAGSLRPLARMSAVLPGAALTMAVALILLALAPNAWAAALTAAPIGAAVGLLHVSGMAWLQRRSDPALHGRVMSLVMFAIMGLTPFSYAFAGAVAEAGAQLLFIGAGAAMLPVAVATRLSSAWRAEVQPAVR